MTLTEVQSEAIQPYLASKERVLETYQRQPKREGERPPFYALTNRRLLELKRGKNDNNRGEITLTARPIDQVTGVRVKRTADGSDHDDEMIIAGALAGVAGLVLALFPAPGDLRPILIVAGAILGIVGLILFFEGQGSGEDGKIEIQLFEEDTTRSTTLPIGAEGFAQAVAARLGQSAE